jgi:hypothetical protein
MKVASSKTLILVIFFGWIATTSYFIASLFDCGITIDHSRMELGYVIEEGQGLRRVIFKLAQSLTRDELFEILKECDPRAKTQDDELQMGDTVFKFKANKLVSVKSFNHTAGQ